VDVPDLLVLRNGDFQPAGDFGGIIEPDFIRTADLNGDGRQDLILSRVTRSPRWRRSSTMRTGTQAGTAHNLCCDGTGHQ